MGYSQSTHKAPNSVRYQLCEGGTRPIQWKCRECSLLMCRRCRSVVHPMLNYAVRHKIVFIKESKSGTAEGNVSFSDYKCLAHTSKICCFYCKDCEQLICRKCSTKAHRGHDTLNEEDYVREINKILKTLRESEKKLSNFTLANIVLGKLNSLKSGATEKPEIKVFKTFSSNVKFISSVISSPDDSVWIVDFSAKVLQQVKLTGDNIQVISQCKIPIYDMAVTSSNNVLLSVIGAPRLKLLNGNTRQISDSKYNVAPLWTCGIHVTRDRKVIIGAVTTGTLFMDTGRQMVIVINEEGTRVKQYELDNNKKPLFTFPYRITSTSNGNICVVDVLDKSYRGRVVVLAEAGNVVQIYNGHPDVNSLKKTFRPSGIVTTPGNNIVVADCDNHTLHILSCDGAIFTYIRTDDVGIRFPYSLALSGQGHLYIGCASTDSDKAKLYQVQFSGF